MLFFILLGIATPCTLLDGESSSKAKPSLTKCYKYNKDACCVSAHDQKISDDYEKMFSSQCLREYDNLENYFCYGCNPSQADSIDEDEKTITICKGFAESVWGTNLFKPSQNFDNCGMNTFWRGDDSETVVPSAEWSNGYQFFWEVKPTFFEDYTILIRDSSDDDKCYSSAEILALGVILFSF